MENVEVNQMIKIICLVIILVCSVVMLCSEIYTERTIKKNKKEMEEIKNKMRRGE